MLRRPGTTNWAGPGGPVAISVLQTDGYKFSMAEAGWPLRKETFFYCHRKGGPQVLPVDVQSYVRSILPSPEAGDYEYLSTHDYDMGAGFKVGDKSKREVQESRKRLSAKTYINDNIKYQTTVPVI